MRAKRRCSGALGGIAFAILGAPLAGGCASGPGAAERLRVENELLREELRVVRSNCSYYRDIEMEVDEEPEPGAR